jgi:hypothetical protein
MCFQSFDFAGKWFTDLPTNGLDEIADFIVKLLVMM